MRSSYAATSLHSMQLNKDHVEHGRPSTAKNKERNNLQKEARTKAPLTITFDISGSSIHLLLLLVIIIYWMLFMNNALIIYSTFINQYKWSYLVSSLIIILQVGRKPRKNNTHRPRVLHVAQVGCKPSPAQVQGLCRFCTCLYFKNTFRIHTNPSQPLLYLSPQNITVIIFILVNNIQWCFSH